MGGYGGNRSGSDYVHSWDPPPQSKEKTDFYTPPPVRKTFDDMRREAPVQTTLLKSPKAQISCLTQAGILLSLDTTGSMGQNPREIWNRAPLAAKESAHAMGLPLDEVSLGFMTHGDAYTEDKFSVSNFVTCGPEIDTAMQGLSLNSNGGGNRVESYDITLAYIERYLALGKKCQHVDVFLVGDEGIPLSIDPAYYEIYVGKNPAHTRTEEVVKTLRERNIRIHFIMMTNTSTNQSYHQQICSSWEEVLGGRAGIWKLSDPRRIADLMLLIMGWQANRLDEAKQSFEERQHTHGERRFAEENIPLVYNAFEHGRQYFPDQMQAEEDVGSLPLDND